MFDENHVNIPIITNMFKNNLKKIPHTNDDKGDPYQ